MIKKIRGFVGFEKLNEMMKKGRIKGLKINSEVCGTEW
jgi:fatty acid-binding protein DegV